MTYCGPNSCPLNDPQGELCFKVECNQGIPYPSTSQWSESRIEEEPVPKITACDLSEVCEKDRLCPFYSSNCRLS